MTLRILGVTSSSRKVILLNRKRETFQAYLAGIFDGEGSVGVYKRPAGNRHKHYTISSVQIQLRMSDPIPVLLFHKQYGGFYSVTRFNENPKWQTMHVWSVTGNNAYQALKELKPYVIAKKDQISLSLSYLCEARRVLAASGSCTTEKFQEYGEYVDARLKELKKTNKGVNSVDSWLFTSREYRSKLADAKEDIDFFLEKLEGVETKHRTSQSVEAMSAPEKDIVH